MITLETIVLLDEKINGVVKLIEDLRSENALLKSKIDGYREKISKLEELVSTFKEDQDKIESGIHSVVKTLDQMLIVTNKSPKTANENQPSDSTLDKTNDESVAISQEKLLDELVKSDESKNENLLSTQNNDDNLSNNSETVSSQEEYQQPIQDDFLDQDDEEIENLDIF